MPLRQNPELSTRNTVVGLGLRVEGLGLRVSGVYRRSYSDLGELLILPT